MGTLISGLRGTFEEFIKSKLVITSIELPFSNPVNTRQNYKIPIYLQDFVGEDIIIWGAVGKTIQTDIQKQKFNIIRDENVKSVSNQLAEDIQTVGGYVKIFPIYLISGEGFKANVDRLGILPNVNGLSEPNSFIIDLRNPNSPEYENSMYILRHISFLLHGLPVGFSVEPVSSTFDQHRAYYFITYQGFLKSSQIYTSSGNGRQYILKYYEKFSDPDNPGNQITFYNNIDEHNRDWKEAFKYKISMKSGGRAQFNTHYLNWLKTSSDSMAIYIRSKVKL